ncbi:hypothetical protein [Peribacillus frigoritolerans]|uniref:hypothetical protein n=1 Tax=Peribacillus frigoritolerans TaxID=450367 RepID=UPI00223002AC|nr:hypothetical protein [Peribacillus frigoritolerans]MDM5312139.1 hypothetical protein [Peribacillus frigoritolerans]UZD46459.1 hypothetical protein OMJ04_23275 [Peribacillus frigoritolerans]
MFYESVIGWKKFATLLPKSWLAKTPQALVPRRLGRQSAERERISEIDWNTFKIKKLQALALYVFLLFYESVIGWKKFAILLPKSWLAKTPQALEPRRLGRQSAERERISEIDWNTFKIKKNCRHSLYLPAVWGERIAPYLLVPKFHKPNGL